MSRFGLLRSEASEFFRHLERRDCRLLREGSSHSLYVDPEQRKVTTIPRHREMPSKICRDPGVAEA